ncbi:hypothetical protein [Pseudomonas sp. PDM04]|uniref:hypothetical protein n=1 Tax=Pseudomonas sp. PDM04 TaxID=2769296 RepID=UPI00177BB248|nr:hypothetical protein [Pseudomonas sp. PDM04]MBD9443062.1 hypothetical protein [Pseudomonas sp. PDM04]
MSAQQQVITIDDISADNAPAIYVAGGLGQFFEAVKAEVTGEVPDLKTAKGRARIASLAATVSKSKTAVEKPGRDYLKRLKEMPKVVEAELREFVTKMDALRDATRQPLTEWEEAEQARKDKHVDGIQAMKDFLIFEGAPSAGQVGHIIAILELVAVNDTWEEFLAEAAQVKDETLAKLRALHAERARYEAEQAELARLRAEAEARALADREAAIAREAAERAQQEAEERVRAEREAAAQREQALIDAAEREKREAENQRLQLQLQAEQAERQRVEAEQRAEQERIAAEQRQAEAVKQARLAEVARQQAEANEAARQQQEREADQAHKVKIMGAAKEALMSMNITEELAKAIVLKIARREIPNITIHF